MTFKDAAGFNTPFRACGIKLALQQAFFINLWCLRVELYCNSADHLSFITTLGASDPDYPGLDSRQRLIMSNGNFVSTLM